MLVRRSAKDTDRVVQQPQVSLKPIPDGNHSAPGIDQSEVHTAESDSDSRVF